MEDERVSLTFDSLLDDHLAAERLYHSSTVLATIDRIVAVALLLVGVLAVWGAGARWWTLVFFPLAALGWFNRLTLRPLLIKRWFKSNPKFSETYHLVLDDAGMHFKTASIDSRVAWNHYTRVLEDDRLWLLVYGTRMYSVIPKRVFKDADDMERFRSLVTRHITGRSN